MKSNKQLQDELEKLKSNKQKAERAENRNEELIKELAVERETVAHLKVLKLLRHFSCLSNCRLVVHHVKCLE